MWRIILHGRDFGDLPNSRNNALLAFDRKTSGAAVYNFPGVVAQKPKKAALQPEPLEGEVYLRAWRKKHRKTLQWMAETIGSDIGTLSEVETRRGAKGVKGRGRWLYDYSRALGISPEKLTKHPDAPLTTIERIAEAPPELLQNIERLVAQFNQRN